ncbi:MAG: TrkH family potassium uptake protein [Gammaproteobacteria bacterium]|nr:TrkH family potassium uptake protein [Gammaproteobacteria bacterium]
MGPILQVFSRLVLLASGFFLFPLLVSLIYQDGTAWEWLLSLFLTLGLGLALWAPTRIHGTDLKTRDGFLLVVLMWTGFAAVATLPLLLSIKGLSFTDAYFETASGLTTTGSTVLTGLDQLPEAINFWRHFLNWIGGMGIIVLAVAILPLLGVGGMQLVKAETPGPMKDDKLAPRIAVVAKNLYLVYSGITLACILALKAAGMNWLDAICHGFATLSLGGFSTHDSSVGYFQSLSIELIMIFFMMLAAMNFPTHYQALRDRSLKPYLRDPEAKALWLLMLVSALGLSLYLVAQGTYNDFGKALRDVGFNLVSVGTDSGFASMDYGQWPIFVPLWILLVSSIAAGSGSTGGGIKMIRTLVIAKQGEREIQRLIHPAGIFPLRLGKTVIANKVVFAVLAFVFFYFMSMVMLTLILTASGLDFLTALSAIVATLNNAGPGLGQVGPAGNYQGLSDFQTWICTLSMLLGRLECFTIFVVLSPAFWRR